MLAVSQACATPANKAANLARMEAGARAASAVGAKLLIFPELFLTGYNLPPDQLRDLAEPASGASIAQAQVIARNNGIALLFGFPERDGASLFNSAALIDASGSLVTVYRKIQLFGERERSVFTLGDRLAVVDLPPFRIGVAICYDIEFPEYARSLAKLGANLIVVPTANMAPYWDVPTTLVRARALENGVAVAYANLCGTEGNLTYTGLSGIVGPDGMDIARAGRYAEALLVADVAHAIERPSIDTSTQLHDLRRDVVTLS